MPGVRVGAGVSIWALMGALRREGLADARMAGAPAPLREGMLFAHALARVPIGIPAGAALAGALGWQWATAGERERWRAPAAPAAPASPPSPLQLLHQRFHCHASSGGDSHTTVDYGRVVSDGLGGIVWEIEREMQDAAPPKRAYLEGMRAALRGVMRWSGRYALLAEARAAVAPDEEERLRLRRIARHCRHVPHLPARTFAEAVQAVWLTHLAVGLSEGSGSSLSLGRLDQYLFPLYRRDLERGAPEVDPEAALEALFRALNAFFGDPACTVNLGGADAEGRCLFNPLSRLIVQVAGRLQLPAPILAARIHDGIPQDVFDLYTDPALFRMGQPTFYGEEACVQALRRRGVPAGDAHAWAVNSCMGLMMPGQEWSNMWGSVVNLLLPLELALNGGHPFRHELPIPLATPAPAAYDDFDTLFETVCAATTELVDLLIAATAAATEQRGQERPNPFVSALLAECIRSGRDRLLGGCRYQTVIVEAFGLVNVADALLAIRQLAFEEGRFTLAEMAAAARRNFEGRPEILSAVRKAPKFGNDHPEADALARRLADRFAQAVTRHSRGGLAYLPSFHTLNVHVAAGAKTAASLDGRLAGAPLAKNIGTSPGRAAAGHTALMRSAAAIDQAAFSGGQALDLSVDVEEMRTPEGRRRFQALLRAYFRLGGLQVQVNGLSPEMLRQAMADPESHQDLLVRIAGYTARYVTLPRDVQEEMVTRLENGV